MNLAAVMAEVGEKLGTIPDLRVAAYPANAAHPPAAFVLLPDSYDFDQTYGRGSDSLTLPVLVMVGKADARASHGEIVEYAAGSGARSVKAAVDGEGTSYDDARVRSVEFNIATVAAVDYLAATFNIDIYGPGS